MKILWLVNMLLPVPANHLGIPRADTGGWVNGLLADLKDRAEIVVCNMQVGEGKQVCLREGGVTYLVLYAGGSPETAFAKMLAAVKPDLVHIFGTEHASSLAMMRISEPARTFVQIQGSMALCAQQFFQGMPAKKCRRKPMCELAVALLGHGTNMHRLYRSFIHRAEDERETLARCRHVLGHTEWDAAIAKRQAPRASYHRFNETLRDVFYTDDQWRPEQCRPHSIFVSQASYPIKGFHMLLRALPEIVREYPDTHVYVGGDYPVHKDRWISRRYIELAYDYYGYILRLVNKYNLRNHITFLGLQDAAAMRTQYLAANVFVSCSSSENESNSLSEAKILGVPCVASYVGGVTERLTHAESGFFYPYNETEMLEYYIKKIFSEPALASRLGQAAREEALMVDDRSANAQRVFEIYSQVLREEEGS